MQEKENTKTEAAAPVMHDISTATACGGKTNGEDKEIDFIELACYLWKERRFLLKVGGCSLVAALVIVFSLPKEYTTVIKLAPETEDVSKKISGLGGLAAMAGINLNTSSGADAISPDLYPDVVQSVPFLLELFPTEINYKKGDERTSLYAYMTLYQRSPWWNYLTEAPFKALRAIKGVFVEKKEEPSGSAIDPFHLTSMQEEIIRALRDRISISVDKKTLVITLSVQMQNALASAQVAQIVQDKLQTYITAYRTRKVKDDLEFTQTVFDDARTAYYKAQQAYAAFEDANRNIISSSYRTELERLKNEMTLSFNVYNTLAQKLEQDKLRVQEKTPIYTVIEPATVPLTASSPKKMLILIGVMLLGFLGGIGYLFLSNLWKSRNGNLFCGKKDAFSCKTIAGSV